MTRKDTIMLAVVINTGLLAVLLGTAIIYDTDAVLNPSEISSAIVESTPPARSATGGSRLIAAGPTGDEVDNVLNYYQRDQNSSTASSQSDVYINEPASIRSDDEEEKYDTIKPSQDGLVEVSVKRGDSLDKIARTNGTTVSAIKKINQLQSEKLAVGQTLKVPVKVAAPLLAESQVAPTQAAKKKEAEEIDSQPQYYTLKNGDNPWKIAKQFNVKVEDIVRLNQLDEEKARNLKAGDRIRIK